MSDYTIRATIEFEIEASSADEARELAADFMQDDLGLVVCGDIYVVEGEAQS